MDFMVLLLASPKSLDGLLPKRPSDRPPICSPYPGCPTPNVAKELCGFRYWGELCGVIDRAHASGTVKNDTLLIDVGAAWGNQIWIGRHYGHPVLAFECRADEHARLQRQFASDPLVKVLKLCLSDQNSVQKMFIADDSSTLEWHSMRMPERRKMRALQRQGANMTEQVRLACAAHAGAGSREQGAPRMRSPCRAQGAGCVSRERRQAASLPQQTLRS